MGNLHSVPCDPIYPDELERLKIIYETARYGACLSRHDPAAERLAALAIHFYQLGIRDDDALTRRIIEAGRSLRHS